MDVDPCQLWCEIITTDLSLILFADTTLSGENKDSPDIFLALFPSTAGAWIFELFLFRVYPSTFTGTDLFCLCLVRVFSGGRLPWSDTGNAL